MLLKLSQELSACLGHAAEARQRANTATDPEIKKAYLDVENSWMQLAERIRLGESVDQFLDDASRTRASIEATAQIDDSHVTPIKCEKCGWHGASH